GWMFPSTTTVSLTDELGGVSTGSSPILMAGVLYTKVEVHATGGYEFTTGFHPAPALKMVLAITDRTRCNELQYETTAAKVDTVNSSDLAQPTRLYQISTADQGLLETQFARIMFQHGGTFRLCYAPD
ncbi:hypothetical protein FOZ63_014472, partial [Perkinsus olseni]